MAFGLMEFFLDREGNNQYITIKEYENGFNGNVYQGNEKPFAAVMLGNLRNLLDQDPTVSAVVKRLSEMCRENLFGSEKEGEYETYSHSCISK